MNEKLIVIGMMLVFLIVGLSGCTEFGQRNVKDSDSDKLIGTWLNSDGGLPEIVFLSDGTGSYNSGTMYWELKNGKLVMDSNSARLIYDYRFENNATELVLIKPSYSWTLIKQ